MNTIGYYWILLDSNRDTKNLNKYFVYAQIDILFVLVINAVVAVVVVVVTIIIEFGVVDNNYQNELSCYTHCYET